MLKSKITAKEWEMMTSWRNMYAFSSEATTCTSTYAPMEDILTPWERAKSEYLDRLFGGELILTKELTYEKDMDTLTREMGRIFDSSFGRNERTACQFADNWYGRLNELRTILDRTTLDYMRDMLEYYHLAGNIYRGAQISFKNRTGKTITIKPGCKLVRAIGKVADAFNIEGFEDFRICHSQILNDKYLSGTLTLSIHPFDYMTMSDNTYGWDSCMNWSEEGGYRQGTVEMMNSQCVVVAYFSGGDKMRISHDNYWNSKKWRQLFVVDPLIIAGVKDYPYHNESLTVEIMKWLKELAETNLQWKYKDIFTYDFSHKTIKLDDDTEFYIEMDSHHMYNDFGCLDYHYLCLADTLSDDDLISYPGYNAKILRVAYSGVSECMVCGELDPALTDDSCLACDSCQGIQCCDECGETHAIYGIVDGLNLCESCYDYYVRECSYCNEDHHINSMYNIVVAGRSESREKLREEYLQWNCWNDRNDSDIHYVMGDADTYCCHKHLDDWRKEYLKPGEPMIKVDMPHGYGYLVYEDQILDEHRNDFYIPAYDGQPWKIWSCRVAEEI